MGVTNHLLTGMILQVGLGYKLGWLGDGFNDFCRFHPGCWGNDRNLTDVFQMG